MKNRKVLLGIFIALVTILVVVAIVFTVIHSQNKNKPEANKDIVDSVAEDNKDVGNIDNVEPSEDGNVDIINIYSKTRPYAICVNNTPVAVKVQTGLNKAYLVYEIPTEGNTSRLLALYKDLDEDLTIGTIRSARHNFIDYALESDAIFVHYGWSHYAKDDETAGSINFINGLFDAPFWRENPENLASEHTAYTSLDKIKKTVESKKFKTESDNTILLNYNPGDVNLSNMPNVKSAKSVIVSYGNNPNVTSFIYDENNKVYNRMENNINCVDYKTKENIDTKNIIVQKITYQMCDDNYYWNLKTTGTGTGYFITNGYAVPITWKKENRKSKTKYYYEDGTEIEVSDGRTYIEVQTTGQNLTIE